ncbi:hypothetical protein NNA36_16005 [Shimia sp. CNT1-13L.2]|uniref:hypothetical protein n=1 Tax=Shimia sp. CNT1-13L.2 TaxID=2959663 RepID=UPI0020CC51D0|nr:hypothetical protein [Shimia sp. CNT1-13L.2]MCP9483469.1 hypothetical protein [Shimia sp. CNT1-13L.2]
MALSQRSLKKMGFSQVEPNLYRAHLEHYAVDLFVQEKTQLTVCFDHLGRPEALPTREREGWGKSFLESHTDHSGLFIKPDRTNWFREPGLIEFLRSIGDIGLFSNFKKTMTYGGSMGGYAAIAFADLCHATTVFSLNPQATLRQDAVPWEPRFLNGKEEDWDGPLWLASDGCKKASKVFLVYDRQFTLDRKHVEMMDLPNVVELNVPFVGHKVPKHLRNMGCLDDLYHSISEENYDTCTWQKRVRARRKLPEYRETLLSSASGPRKRTLEKILARLKLLDPEELANLERKEKRDLARIIGFSTWIARYKSDNPSAPQEEIKIAWAEARESETQAGIRALAAVERAGYQIVPPE